MQTCQHTNTHRQTDRQTDRPTDRPTDKQTDRQTADRHADRQTYMPPTYHTYMHVCIYLYMYTTYIWHTYMYTHTNDMYVQTTYAENSKNTYSPSWDFGEELQLFRLFQPGGGWNLNSSGQLRCREGLWWFRV